MPNTSRGDTARHHVNNIYCWLRPPAPAPRHQTFALCFWTSKIYAREELALASHQCNLYVMARTAKASLESNAIAHPSFFCLFDVRTTHHCIDMKTVLLTTWL